MKKPSLKKPTSRFSPSGRYVRWVVLVALLVLVGTSLGMALTSLTDWRPLWEETQRVFGSPEALREFVAGFGGWAPLVYFATVVGQVVVSPIPAGPVTLAGALAFGVGKGLGLSLAGSIAGSVIVFWAVRRWGEPLLARIVGKEVLKKYSGSLDPKGWWLFAILLLPLMPDDAVCALAGLSAISFKRFLVVMAIGRIPGTTMTALLASDAVTGSGVVWVSVGLILVALLALGFAYRRRLESWVLSRAGSDPSTGERRR